MKNRLRIFEEIINNNDKDINKKKIYSSSTSEISIDE
jgi:hypothetical protein